MPLISHVFVIAFACAGRRLFTLLSKAVSHFLPPEKTVGNFGHKIAISELAGAQGFEPRMLVPETSALPLGDAPLLFIAS